MIPPMEALSKVEALCAEADVVDGMVPAEWLRAVLAQVQPEPVALDRDQARDVLADAVEQLTSGLNPHWDKVLDSLAACVLPAPHQTIDRDALTHLLLDGREPADAFDLRDRILALLRPVEGPPQTIDRGTLVDLIMEKRDSAPRLPNDYDSEELADDILALLRPISGVVLTREDIRVLLSWYVRVQGAVSSKDVALANRLKAEL